MHPPVRSVLFGAVKLVEQQPRPGSCNPPENDARSAVVVSRFPAETERHLERRHGDAGEHTEQGPIPDGIALLPANGFYDLW